MDKINILWTGGWDSTYRVLELSFKPVTVQPYYINDNRKSEEIELKTIDIITREIQKNPNAKCIILKPIFKKVKDIEKDSLITNAYYNLLKNNFFGSQYDWLARFAKSVDDLELTIHEDDTAVQVIKNNGSTIKKQDASKGEYYILDQQASSEDLIKVFAHFNFPLLNITKLEMKNWAEKNGLIDIMNKTWFCHTPINNEPCGICNPCIYTIEEGLQYRFSKKALRRYHFNKRFVKPIKNSGIYKRAKNIYKSLKNI